MKTIAYVRVSTDAQDVTHQRLAILEFARTERLVVDAFLEMQASARSSLKARHIEVLFDSLERGDTLIVSELSRLGRSVGEIITTVDRLVHHQIRVFALKEGLRLTGAQHHLRVLKPLPQSPRPSPMPPVAVSQGEHGHVVPTRPARRIPDGPDAVDGYRETVASGASRPGGGLPTTAPAPAAAGYPAPVRSGASY